MRRWFSVLARAGVAYAAIIFSIVGISIPAGDSVMAPKKVAESPAPPEKASGPSDSSSA